MKLVKLIGLGQTEDQKAMLSLIEEARKPIEEGNVQAIAVVMALKTGPAWAMAGSAAAALFLALSFCMDEIKEKVQNGTQQMFDRIIKPRKQ